MDIRSAPLVLLAFLGFGIAEAWIAGEPAFLAGHRIEGTPEQGVSLHLVALGFAVSGMLLLGLADLRVVEDARLRHTLMLAPWRLAMLLPTGVLVVVAFVTGTIAVSLAKVRAEAIFHGAAEALAEAPEAGATTLTVMAALAAYAGVGAFGGIRRLLREERARRLRYRHALATARPGVGPWPRIPQAGPVLWTGFGLAVLFGWIALGGDGETASGSGPLARLDAFGETTRASLPEELRWPLALAATLALATAAGLLGARFETLEWSRQDGWSIFLSFPVWLAGIVLRRAPGLVLAAIGLWTLSLVQSDHADAAAERERAAEARAVPQPAPVAIEAVAGRDAINALGELVVDAQVVVDGIWHRREDARAARPGRGAGDATRMEVLVPLVAVDETDPKAPPLAFLRRTIKIEDGKRTASDGHASDAAVPSSIIVRRGGALGPVVSIEGRRARGPLPLYAAWERSTARTLPEEAPPALTLGLDARRASPEPPARMGILAALGGLLLGMGTMRYSRRPSAKRRRIEREQTAREAVLVENALAELARRGAVTPRGSDAGPWNERRPASTAPEGLAPDAPAPEGVVRDARADRRRRRG